MIRSTTAGSRSIVIISALFFAVLRPAEFRARRPARHHAGHPSATPYRGEAALGSREPTSEQRANASPEVRQTVDRNWQSRKPPSCHHSSPVISSGARQRTNRHRSQPPDFAYTARLRGKFSCKRASNSSPRIALHQFSGCGDHPPKQFTRKVEN